MTKHVEIWTLSKKSRVVPYMTDFVELYEYYPPPDMYVRSDDVLVDKVERRYMNTVRVSKSEAIYDRMEIEQKIEQSDKYIAIHPDVEEAISVKWKEKVGLLETNLSFWKNYGKNLRGNLDDFKLLPWYKRVWIALTNQI